MDQFVSSVHGEPHDIGDVNGDGYDDIFHGGYGSGLGFRIIKGRNMNLTGVGDFPIADSPQGFKSSHSLVPEYHSARRSMSKSCIPSSKMGSGENRLFIARAFQLLLLPG